MVGDPGVQRPRAPARDRGFSLVELIVVIVITGIIASVVGLFITGPIQGFIDTARRAELVDAAQLALTRMGRDLRAALPNSVRISGNALEVLLTADGARYRVEQPGTAADRLQFAAADDAFNTLTALSPPATTTLGTAYRVTGALAIYPLQQAGANPYVLADGVMTPFGDLDITPVTNGTATEYQVSLTSAGGTAPGAQRFPFDSPTRRVYLVSAPVTWYCNPPQLLRYEGYAVTAIQAVPPTGTPVVIADNVRACVFQYAAGTAQRNAVVSIALSLAESDALEERVRLIRQVHVNNSP